MGSTTNQFILDAGNTSYPSFAAAPTTGIFGWQQSYGIQSVTDGTSNTLAYGESVVGRAIQAPQQTNIGLINVAIPAAALVYDAKTAPAAVLSGIQACDAAWNSPSATVDLRAAAGSGCTGASSRRASRRSWSPTRNRINGRTAATPGRVAWRCSPISTASTPAASTS